jgi:hypothetical protein
MSELHLDSLEIKNFRCFEHLTIEKLGRVNLIVGRNSVGKTALLEALWLLGSEADWTVIQKMLYDRSELVRYRSADARDEQYSDHLERQEQLEAVKSFFFGRPPKNIGPARFYTGTSPVSDGTMTTEAIVFTIASNQRGISLAMQHGVDKDVYLHHDNEISRAINKLADLQSSNLPENASKYPVFSHIFIPPLPKKNVFDYAVIEKSKDHKMVYIPLSGLTWKATCTYWDDLALTDREEAVISFMQIIEPSIKRFTFKGENMDNRVRYPVVKTERFPEPLPLANLGDGIQRVFGIALAMSIASNGYLLIDEVEAGLYHRAQPDVWRAVFKLAHDWNVQVFATTHSWDCVEAFQEAAAEDQNEEAMLIRLTRRKNGQIRAVPYNEEELAIATEQNIEVR